MVITSREVYIRKPHRCFGCNIEFSKGTRMTVVVWKDDNLTSNYWCEVCNSYWKEYMTDDSDGIYQGELIYEEHYRNYKENYLNKKDINN